jgi:hypothetical protein
MSPWNFNKSDNNIFQLEGIVTMEGRPSNGDICNKSKTSQALDSTNYATGNNGDCTTQTCFTPVDFPCPEMGKGQVVE